MTDKKSNETTRSKLTLKLSSSPVNQSTVSKNQKIGNSSVQVTIKGRKREASQDDVSFNPDNTNLAKKLKLVSKSEEESINKNVKTHEILADAIKKEKDKQQQSKQKQESNFKLEKKEIENKIEKKQEIKEEIKEEKKEIIVEQNQANTKTPDYLLDNFDIRNKIKQSVQETNRQKEEREKIIQEKKQKEQERIEKEKVEKEKKKGKKNVSNKNFFDDEPIRKASIKEKKSTKKLTYIIDNDSEDRDFSFRRKKKKNKDDGQQINKEYKKISREVMLPELITVAELADRMSEKTGDVVKKLFSMGMVVTSNQAIDADTAEIITNEFGHKVKRVSHSDVENVLEDDNEIFQSLPRAPIVTIMGHVDHGKTSLLDALRKTDVVSKEHGGITQHIGASRIKTKDGEYITFLDTPGHEAFTEMRSRGANVTDIVVLVVAADDGVKEQTIEAINHAKAANVPMIVAVNKIDKPNCDPDKVKYELLTHQVVAEDLGGDVMFIPVSAKSNLNLDKLEEAILLQANLLELKSPYEGKASGVVLESRVDPSKGVVATLLVQKGSLNISDLIVVGTSYGSIRKMTDNNGESIDIATPSIPVEVLGLNIAPNSGEKFFEVDEEKQAREIIAYRDRKEKEEKALKNSAKSLTDIFKESGKGKLKYLNVVIKADVHGSVEAINGTIGKMVSEEVMIKTIHSATGGITESDISLASASNAIVIGFNVRANASVREVARLKGVEIRYYSIIYNLVDDLKLMLSGMLDPIKNEEYLGQAEIRQVFKVSGAGKIAGAFVIDGLIKRNAKARLLRDNVVIHDGILKTLKRFKDDVKEVKNNFECGISFENYDDIKEKDIIECYEIVTQKRVL